jgi:hypothetical protein
VIETPEETFRAQLQACVLGAAAAFTASVRPIFGALPDGRPEHVGSCILLNIDGRRVLSTAAHIAEQLRERKLFVGGPTETSPVPIGAGKWKATLAPGGSRRSDHYDCAFWQVPDAALPRMGAVEFLGSSHLSASRIAAVGRWHTALGYPVSRNKDSIDHAARSIINRRSIYTARVVELPQLAAKLGTSGGDHLFLPFEKYSHDTEGKRVNSFKPVGLSGGALLDLGDFTSPPILARDPGSSARLSGMLIEHHRHHNALVAVKIGPVVEGIRNSLS